MLFAPNYYHHFQCIADRCQHSCCIGWEIDIDADALAYYQNIKGAFGDKLRRFISEEETPHFILGEHDRCPFLNKKNLCDIYTELGEEHLCQICADHPRFRNFLEDRTEIGLGLSCEAAAELILTFPDPMQLICNETGTPVSCFPEREHVFSILQNRTFTVEKRVETLKEAFSVTLPDKTFSEWRDFFLSLEILDERWRTLLESTGGTAPSFSEKKWQIALEQLLVYFVFRHMHRGLETGSFSAPLAFCIFSTEWIKRLCRTESDLFEVARMFSQELEYCEENTDELMFEMEIG